MFSENSCDRSAGKFTPRYQLPFLHVFWGTIINTKNLSLWNIQLMNETENDPYCSKSENSCTKDCSELDNCINISSANKEIFYSPPFRHIPLMFLFWINQLTQEFNKNCKLKGDDWTALPCFTFQWEGVWNYSINFNSCPWVVIKSLYCLDEGIVKTKLIQNSKQKRPIYTIKGFFGVKPH